MVSGEFEPPGIAGVWCFGPQNDARPLRGKIGSLGFQATNPRRCPENPEIHILNKAFEPFGPNLCYKPKDTNQMGKPNWKRQSMIQNPKST